MATAPWRPYRRGPGKGSLGQTVAQVMRGDNPLAALLAQHRRATACMAHIQPLLPPNLRGLTRPGPIDGHAWTLLVDNTAAAAKLRQLLPMLQAALQAQEPLLEVIRLKVSPRQTDGL
jgi:hypothetical protein